MFQEIRLVRRDIAAIHCADWLLDAGGAVDPNKIRTVGRLGGLNYCNASDVFELPRPK